MMTSKILIVCIGIVFLIGCAEKNISKKVDEETRASMRQTYERGKNVNNMGNNIGGDVRRTLEQSITK